MILFCKSDKLMVGGWLLFLVVGFGLSVLGLGLLFFPEKSSIRKGNQTNNPKPKTQNHKKSI